MLSHSPAQNRFLWTFPILLLAVSLACGLPLQPRPTPTIPAPTQPPTTPTPTPLPLPPAVVESEPPPGAEIPLNSAVTLYFNQPMNRTSVEASFRSGGSVSGRFTWIDDATVTFQPDVPLLPDTSVTYLVADTAQSSQGLTLPKPIEISFRTASSLRLAQKLPEDGAASVDPGSAVVAAFNYPVVPLGAEAASLPAAFTLDPPANGSGEWINTSTYLFHPQPALAGGLSYTVHLNPELKSTLGSPLESTVSWTFSVARPELVSGEPVDGDQAVRLDTGVRLTFNQPMNPESAAASFALLGPGNQPVEGSATWNDDFTTLVFTPTVRLQRSTSYLARLAAGAQAAGGVPIEETSQFRWNTVPALSVLESTPVRGGFKQLYEDVSLKFNSYLPAEGIEPYLTLNPPIRDQNLYLEEDGRTLHVFGNFSPSTEYTLKLDSRLTDLWGGNLQGPYTLRFRTLPLPPSLAIPLGSQVMFLTSQDTGISAQVANLPTLPLALGSVPLPDFLRMMAQGGYQYQEEFQPLQRRTWTASLSTAQDRSETVSLPLTPEGKNLSPGLYLMRFNPDPQSPYPTTLLLVVSDVNLTFKLSASDALVWAVDLQTHEPVGGAPVTIYDETGNPIASGETDAEGIFQAAVPPRQDPFSPSLAVLGEPEGASFSIALSTWNQGIEAYNFDLPFSYRSPGLISYLYTDRPVYRPGQTVYFRVVARQIAGGQYALPTASASLPITLYDSYGSKLTTFNLPISAFGTAHGAYTLVSNARPGYYRLESGEDSINFQVAEYRKPEVNLQVGLSPSQVTSGGSLTALVSARYFFDAPVGNTPVQWVLYEAPHDFFVPNYQIGPASTRWLDLIHFPGFGTGLGLPVDQGQGTTDSDGKLTLELPTVFERQVVKPSTSRRLTLEVTLTDESGLPVSARATATVHPAAFYIGIQPDLAVPQAGVATGYTVQVLDWDGQPAGEHGLHAELRKVTWVRQDPQSPGEFPTYTPQYTPVASTDFATGQDGKARLAFTLPEPGTFQFDANGENALTEIILWAGGPGQPAWPNLPNQRLELTPDRQTYQAGETAQVFVPNPIGAQTLALVTIERETILRHQIVRLEEGGTELPVTLGEADVPNVYVSVTLIGKGPQGLPDFRQGYVNLPVKPVQQTLQVALTSQPTRTGPGGSVTFEIRVSDASGNPVQGEFSLAVVDLAALALADPNAPGIVQAMYGQRPLGVRTGLDLAAYANRSVLIPGGLGGGGGAELGTVVRENFPDTAYWNAEVVTDANGKARVAVNLPDNLTTWQVEVRGLNQDTQVGEASLQVVTTKEVLVRPVVPRFLVSGDYVQMAAVVQNNTTSDLPAEVSLKATGFVLDESQSALQKATVPAGGRVRLEWWGVTQDVQSADLVFTVQAGNYQDASRPVQGALPVLHFAAPQAFATSGVLAEGGKQLELVSLPPSTQAAAGVETTGELHLELAPSLAASALTGLGVLEHFPYECTEQTLSRFLPNLEVYRAVQNFGLDSPELKSLLERTLPVGLDQLLARQNSDGGWGWWLDGVSDPFVTSYILFGLSQAREAGFLPGAEAIQRAVDYLHASLIAPEMAMEPWQLDRLAFQGFALAQAGSGDAAGAATLFGFRERLSPWAQALLALTLEKLSPGSPETQTLLSDLQTNAIRSATGVHWEETPARLQNMGTPASTSAMVIYALARLEPASTLLPDAVRYLMANRGPDGIWASTFDTAWALLGLAEFMRGTGELSGNFDFIATLNSTPLASGSASSEAMLRPVDATAPASRLYAGIPNALSIERSPGTGRLYYTAILDISQPVETVAALNRGLEIFRLYYPRTAECSKSSCAPVQGGQARSQVTVRLTLVVPHDAYYLVVEDSIPAGAEILDTGLKTSQQGEVLPDGTQQAAPLFDVRRPFAEGWGWWYFHAPTIFKDHIAWAADFLQAGTYELTYTLNLLQPGEYRVLPARLWQFYFPDVQGRSSGEVFKVQP